MPKSIRRVPRGRKPLADISNGGTKASRTIKKEDAGDDGVASPRDRLLLAHTDLWKVINQIDVLVTQALEHKFTKKESKEIESFIRVLSDTHSSLKSWVPRLERAFGSSAVEVGDQSKPKPPLSFSSVDGEKGFSPNVTNEEETGLIVSPSPLVSWRNGTCTVESGRQLFLLTPLHKPKSLACKEPYKCLQATSNNKHGSFNRLGLPVLLNAPGSNCHLVVEKADMKPTPNKFSVPNNGASYGTSLLNGPRSNGHIAVEKAGMKPTPNKFLVPETGTSETGLVTGTKIANNDGSLIYCLSPYMKTSPLKACFLLDSVSDSIDRGNRIMHNGTPWVARTQMNSVSRVFDMAGSGKDYESDEIQMTLASKYPELFGLQQTQALTFQRKEVDETLDWFLSPPKTCVLMEPLDEKMALPSGGDRQPLSSENEILNQAVPDTTPMWKDLKSTARHGNAGEATLKGELWTKFEATPMWIDENTTEHGKNAGETTLKRELWTKFEAVSVNGLQFNRSVFQQVSRNRFLDMLEEVS